MKKLLFVFLLSVCAIWAQGPDGLKNKSCCAVSAPSEFAALAEDAAFVMQHEVPGNLVYEGTGETVSLPIGKDVQPASGFLIPAAKNSKNWILVFHEWWGLNEYIKSVASKISADFPECNILAVDMYDGKIATTRDSAAKYMTELDQNRAMEIIRAAIKYTGNGAKIATIGWCMGGGFSMQAAIEAGKAAKACVMYYGMPESDKTRLAKLEAPVLFIHAKKDQWITDGVVKDFSELAEKMRRKLTVKEYDADHAFANPSNTSNYNKAFADDAYAASVAHIKNLLK